MQNNTMYTLSQWAAEWLEVYKIPTVLPQTADGYRQTIQRILTAEPRNILLHTATERDLQQILNAIQRSGYSKNTIEKARNALRQMYGTAHNNGLVSFDPSVHLQIPKAPTKKVLPLTGNELKRVEQACKQDALGHLLLFLLRTGLRRSELMQLKWQDYHPEAGRHGSIYVRKSKTAAGVRTVPLLREAAVILLDQKHTNDDFVFHGSTGTPLTEIVLRRLCTRIQRVAQIPHLSPHVCRHTFVTELCRRGVSPKAIAQIIGHARATYVLDIYAWLDKESICDAIYDLESN